MPITFSHPLAVLPFKQSRLNFTGLVIGTMAPDFTYFFQGSASGHWGHTLQGLFMFCIPVSLIFYFIFHGFMKEALYQLLPPEDERFIRNSESPKQISLPFIMVLIISILIGAGTHNFWDSFTHSYGYFVQRSEFLQTRLFSILNRDISIYKTLQYSGHLLGLPIILAYYLFRFHRTAGIPLFQKELMQNRIILVMKTAAMGLISLLLSGLLVKLTHKNGSFAGSIAVWTINFGVLGTLLYSLLWKIKWRSSAQKSFTC